MKTSFAAILLAISFAHASAWAEWLKVYEDDSLAYYADPSTIRRADNIIVLDEGMVKESGTHQQLMLIEDGLYRNLNRLQVFQQ